LFCMHYYRIWSLDLGLKISAKAA